MYILLYIYSHCIHSLLCTHFSNIYASDYKPMNNENTYLLNKIECFLNAFLKSKNNENENLDL